MWCHVDLIIKLLALPYLIQSNHRVDLVSVIGKSLGMYPVEMSLKSYFSTHVMKVKRSLLPPARWAGDLIMRNRCFLV
jgi:hypothetical protein